MNLFRLFKMKPHRNIGLRNIETKQEIATQRFFIFDEKLCFSNNRYFFTQFYVITMILCG